MGFHCSQEKVSNNNCFSSEKNKTHYNGVKMEKGWKTDSFKRSKNKENIIWKIFLLDAYDFYSFFKARELES